MPRIRTIKPEFFTSPSTAAVDFPVRIFYQALWCWADDFGIGETNLNGLLGFAFCDSDEIWDADLRGFRAVSAPDLRRFCADVAQHFGVTFYTVRGRHYYAIPTWEKHQKLERRTERRKNPTPDDPDATPDQRIYGCADSAPEMPRKNGADLRETCAGTGEQGNRGTGESSLVTYVGGDSVEAPAKPTPRKRGTRITDPDWMPEQKTVDRIKAAFPHVTSDQLRHEHERFICWATGSASANAVKLDWEATWSGWMRRELVKLPTHNGVVNGKPSKARVVAELAARVREQEQHALTNGKEIAG